LFLAQGFSKWQHAGQDELNYHRSGEGRRNQATELSMIRKWKTFIPSAVLSGDILHNSAALGISELD
jgi:hypothetical protein